MLSRYLGNKSSLVPPILEEVDACVPLADRPRVGDLFAGTLAVSLALKQAGCEVVANDVQAFSAAIGEAFLVSDEIPAVPPGLVPRRDQAVALARLRGQLGFRFLADAALAERYARLLDVLDHLAGLSLPDLPPEARRAHFHATYTEAGDNSAFTSSRGRSGRRRFFTPANGLALDAAANQIRWWWRGGLLDRVLYQLLVCCLVRAVEKVSNTQGTYHDFPRVLWDARALKPLQFEPPPMDIVLAGGRHRVGCGDSLLFAESAAPLDVLYLDPPYNFRQYTAYYFLPNLICRYCELDDDALSSWFASVTYVRGQNMADDFTSTFCSKKTFLHDLGTLIDRSRPRFVVLSYFDGRNHWNDFKKNPNGVGRGLLTDFFASERFLSGARLRPIERTNYQSYGGYSARRIQEFLFVAEVRQNSRSQPKKHPSSGAAVSAASGP